MQGNEQQTDTNFVNEGEQRHETSNPYLQQQSQPLHQNNFRKNFFNQAATEPAYYVEQNSPNPTYGHSSTASHFPQASVYLTSSVDSGYQTPAPPSWEEPTLAPVYHHPTTTTAYNPLDSDIDLEDIPKTKTPGRETFSNSFEEELEKFKKDVEVDAGPQTQVNKRVNQSQKRRRPRPVPQKLYTSDGLSEVIETKKTGPTFSEGHEKAVSTTTLSEISDWSRPSFESTNTHLVTNSDEPEQSQSSFGDQGQGHPMAFDDIRGLWKGIEDDSPSQVGNSERGGEQVAEVYAVPFVTQDYEDNSQAPPGSQGTHIATSPPRTGVAPSPTDLPTFTDSLAGLGQRKIHEPSNLKHKTAARLTVDPAKLTHHRKKSYTRIRATTPRPKIQAPNAEDTSKSSAPKRRPTVLRGTYTDTRKSRKMDNVYDYPDYAATKTSSPDFYDYDSNSQAKASRPAKKQHVNNSSPKEELNEGDDDYEYPDHGTSEAIKQLDTLLEDPESAPAEHRSSEPEKTKKTGLKHHKEGPAPYLNVYKVSSAVGNLASKGSIPESSFESFKVYVLYILLHCKYLIYLIVQS